MRYDAEGSLAVATIVHIMHFRWACHIYTAWYFWRAAGRMCELGGGQRQNKNTLQEYYAPSMPSLLQEFVILN